jgi:glycosyltransferase involved in cell wall biosynthesis
MVLTSSPPHSVHAIGWYLKTRHSIPWTIDLRDPMTFGLRSHGSRALERSYFEAADRIILNTPGAQRAFESVYPQFADKGWVIPNGFDPDDYQTSPKPRGAECTILHAGETYADRDPKLLFDAIARCRQAGTLKPVRLEFLGRQNNDYDPVAYCRERGIQDMVEFRGQVPHAEVAKSLQRADVLLLLDNPGRVTGVPAKLYEYLAAKRQILALTEPAGDSAWLLRETGVSHQLAAPGDAEGIATALARVLGDDGSNIGDQLSDRVLGFSRQALTQELSDAMREVLEGGRGGRRAAASDQAHDGPRR